MRARLARCRRCAKGGAARSTSEVHGSEAMARSSMNGGFTGDEWRFFHKWRYYEIPLKMDDLQWKILRTAGNCQCWGLHLETKSPAELSTSTWGSGFRLGLRGLWKVSTTIKFQLRFWRNWGWFMVLDLPH